MVGKVTCKIDYEQMYGIAMEELSGMEEERDQLQAKVEALEGAFDDGWRKSIDKLSANNSKLRASNSRMREALERILKTTNGCMPATRHVDIQVIQEVAQSALQADEGQG